MIPTTMVLLQAHWLALSSTLPFLESLSPELRRSILLLIVSLGALALMALLDGGSRKGTLASSRWATGREQRSAKRKALRQMRQQDLEVALSVGLPKERHALHLPDLQRSLAVAGAPGAGKTFSMLNPLVVSALLQGLPLILYDYKYPKQTSAIAPLAQSLDYDVHIFAPGFPESSCCNPLDFMQDANDITMARQLASVFYNNAVRGQHSSHQGEDGYFTRAGISLNVAALALARASPYPDLAMVHSVLRLPDLPERLKKATDLSLWAKLNFDQLAATAESERTTASIISTAVGTLAPLMDPALLAAFVGTTTLPLKLKQKQLIVLGVDRERRQAITPLIATVLHLLMVHNMATQRQTPLVTSLDELPTLYLPQLVQWINEYRDKGLALLLGFQNLAQLEQTYGPTNARAIFGACATKVLFNPGESQSADRFAQYLGDEEIRYTEVSRSRSHGRTSINRQPQRRTRKLFEASQFLTLPTGKAVFISPGIGSRQQRSIPVQTQIHVPQSIRLLLDRSSAAWHRLCPLLVARNAALNANQESDQQAIDAAAIQDRFDHAATVLPPVIK